MKRITFRLYESNVTLLVGTDTSDLNDPVDIRPGISVHDEMLLLEAAGIPSSEIIAMASTNTARWISVTKSTGTILAGSDADFVILSADPGDGVRNLRAIDSVYQKGRLVFPASR
jgi:imidazolonepropionase-like amidohydrolase